VSQGCPQTAGVGKSNVELPATVFWRAFFIDRLSPFSVLAESTYPSPGADGTLTVTNKFTESLLLPDDPMDMLVSFVPIPDASIAYEYSVFSVRHVDRDSHAYLLFCSAKRYTLG
jgi:hypothetical protein